MNDITTATAGKVLNSDLFAEFIKHVDRGETTARAYRNNLQQFNAWARYAAVEAPAHEDIILYREWLQSEHEAIEAAPDTATGWRYKTDRGGSLKKLTCKPNTVKQYLQTVKKFFAWTAAAGIYPNIAADVNAPKIKEAHRKDFLSAPDVVTIEQSIISSAARRQETAAAQRKDATGRMQRSSEQGKRLFAMYLLAVNAGLRTIEISRANIKDLETKQGNAYLYVWGKGHAEPDTIKPIAPEVYAAIKEYIDSRTDKPTGASPLFVSTGNRSHGKRIAATTISTMLKRALQEAGFDSERLTAHSLRHTVGQNIMQITGENIYKTQLYMRHNSPKTTEIYLDNESAERNADLAQRLYNHYHGTGAESTASEQVQEAMKGMSAAQLEQLARIAAAMTAR